MSAILEQLMRVTGVDGDSIGATVLKAGGAILGAGTALTVANYGVTATANALNNLQPMNTAVNVAKGAGLQV